MQETWIGTVGERIKAFIYDKQTSEYILLLCHGFSGSSSGAFYPQLCDLLVKEHTAIRFDFRGQGESDGKFFDSSLTKELEDVKKVIDFIKAKYPKKKIILLGHSFGSAVALLYASEHQSEIAGFISISGEGDLSKSVEIEFTPEELKEMQSFGKAKVINWSKNGDRDYLGRQYLDDLKKYSTMDAAKKLTIPVLFIHGTNDEVIPVSRTEEMHKIIKSEVKYIEWADHTFNVYTDKPLVRKLSGVILDWIKRAIKEN